jgi:hypothetical protein
MRIPMSQEEYNKIFAEITALAHEKGMEGFEKYGDGLPQDFLMIKEVEEELADTINYIIYGLHLVRKLQEVYTRKEG